MVKKIISFISIAFIFINLHAQPSSKVEQIRDAFVNDKIPANITEMVVESFIQDSMNIYDMQSYLEFHAENSKKILALIDRRNSIFVEESTKISKKYYESTVELVESLLFYYSTDKAKDEIYHLYSDLDEVKYKIINDYGKNSIEFVELMDVIQKVSIYIPDVVVSINNTMNSNLIEFMDEIISKEYAPYTESKIAEEVFISTNSINGVQYNSSFNYFSIYLSENALSDEIRESLGLKKKTTLELTLELINRAYNHSNYREEVRMRAFYSMLTDLSKKIQTKIEYFNSNFKTTDEVLEEEYGLEEFNNLKHPNFSKEYLQKQVLDQINRTTLIYNNAILQNYNLKGLIDFENTLSNILITKEGLENDLNRFEEAYRWYFHYKKSLTSDRIKYANTLKYEPTTLLKYIESILNHAGNLSEDELLLSNIDELDDEQRLILQIIKENYLSIDESYYFQESVQNSSNFEELQKRGRYRDVLLNIALDLHKSGFNLFNDRNDLFITLDDIFDLKTVDYRAKKFITEGINQANSKALIDYHSLLQSKKAELSNKSLMNEVELINYDLTFKQLEESINFVLEKENEIYGLLHDYIDVENFSKEWSTDWLSIQNSLSDFDAFIDIERFVSLEDSSNINYMAIVITNSSRNIYINEDGYLLENDYFKEYRANIFSKTKLGANDRGLLSKRDATDINERNFKNIYWDWFNSSLDGKKYVYLYNDGIYHKINPLTFQVDESDNYLIDNIEIVSINKLSDININKDQRSKVFDEEIDKNSFFLFGRPEYYRSISQRGQVSTNRLNISNAASRAFSKNSIITDLVGTEAEVRQIQAIIDNAGGKSEVFLNVSATEENIKGLENPSVLHIATHGFFSEEISDYTFGSGYFNYSKQILLDNPLLRTGLLLSGAGNSLMGTNSATEDGILTGEEIIYLPLKSTKLVVLSACETGLGEVFNGEGVMGLQRSFLVAGSESVIM